MDVESNTRYCAQFSDRYDVKKTAELALILIHEPNVNELNSLIRRVETSSHLISVLDSVLKDTVDGITFDISIDVVSFSCTVQSAQQGARRELTCFVGSYCTK